MKYDPGKSLREIQKMLQPLNCAYCYKVEEDGRCYSKDCMMNVDRWLKDKIAEKGCKIFLSPEVKVEIHRKEERGKELKLCQNFYESVYKDKEV